MQGGFTILDLRILLLSEVNHIVIFIILFIQFRGTSKVRKHVKLVKVNKLDTVTLL